MRLWCGGDSAAEFGCVIGRAFIDKDPSCERDCNVEFLGTKGNGQSYCISFKARLVCLLSVTEDRYGNYSRRTAVAGKSGKLLTDINPGTPPLTSVLSDIVLIPVLLLKIYLSPSSL